MFGLDKQGKMQFIAKELRELWTSFLGMDNEERAVHTINNPPVDPLAECEQLQAVLRDEVENEVQTVIIQIGNSDDKLTQKEWSSFVYELRGLINFASKAMHFTGGSANDASFQNFCVIADVPKADFARLRRELSVLCRYYRQDSIALTTGATQFVKAPE